MKERVDRFFFPTGPDTRLAAVRIGLCGYLAWRLATNGYRGLADQPAELFRPLSFMKLLESQPPIELVVPLQILAFACAVLACIGFRARITLPVAWVCAVFLGGMLTAIGKVVHNDVLLLLALAPLLGARVGDAWSVDEWLRKRKEGRAGEPHEPRVSPLYGYPVRNAMIIVAFVYCFAGLSKLNFAGLDWATTDNLRYVLYAASDAQREPNSVGLFVAEHNLISHFFAANTLVLETFFPLVLFIPLSKWFFVPGAVGMHLGIALTMHLDYSPWIVTVVVVFVNWPWVIDWLRAQAGKRARPPDVARA